VNAPRYSYQAINALASNDTGHFLYLDTWTVNAVLSILSQERALYLWTNNQFPLTEAEIDDLDNKLSTAQDNLMQSIVGLIMPICTALVPGGTLICDGSTYARADYPALYDALDTFYHVDANTFTVPDMTDRFIVGTGPVHPTNTTGGSFEHTQTIGEMPAHDHTTVPHTHTEVTAGPTLITIGPGAPAPSAVPAVGVTGASGVTVNTAGGGAPMDITPPFLALRFVVVAL